MTRLRAGVVGAGYVGLTTAVCLAEVDHHTVCVDVDAERVGRLNHGVALIDEPGLPLLLQQGLERETLRFTSDYADLADRDVVFVCVPTPSGSDGSADLSAVDAAVDRLASVLRPGAVLVVKSTVPVGTTRRIAERLRPAGIRVVSNPEFLREGHAIYDFRHPDRIVIGVDDDDAAEVVSDVYGAGALKLRMSPESAELAKYASNAFLAVKVSYTNSLARLCSRVGANIDDVTRCMGADVRIGQHFLRPGPGWGGSCLPKDTAALLHTGRLNDVELPEVESARFTNAAQPGRVAATLTRTMPTPLNQARVTALGLTFKAGTSDVRDSPALTICAELARTGAQITGYDPKLASIDHEQLRRSAIIAVDDP
ncbi:MAG TPA: UDP-glucose/GDP-mannose dehydrogenase family protein, partial [Mycobacterium sp.]|nr:UDP-glucose/GDP-mannose dehydrogenase family protein [Mycobacterium sp.]